MGRPTLAPTSGPPLSPPFGSSLTLTESLHVLALSFPIFTGQKDLGASLSSAIRSRPELVNSRAGQPPQLVKGGLAAGGPLWKRAGARALALVPFRGGGLEEACFVICEEPFSSPQSPWGQGQEGCGEQWWPRISPLL